MPESKSVQRRKAIQRNARLYPQGRLRKLAPEVRRALETKSILDVKDIDSFVLGFVAGRIFQHEQITKLLCPACMDGSPISMQSGVPIHEISRMVEHEQVIWRKTCEAHGIYAFKP